MFCPKCGNQLSDNSVICGSCGAQLNQAGAQATQAAMLAPAAPGATAAASSPGINKLIPIIAIAIITMLALLFGMNACSGGSGGGGLIGPKVEPKDSLSAYSWEELSQISAEIAAAGDETAAIEVAKQYNLVGQNGMLDGTQTKMVGWQGSQVSVQIIGFAHDDRTGGGKAGITFQFVDCIAEHDMNPKSSDEADYNAAAESGEISLSDVSEYYPDGVPTNVGGWEASSMREWLNGDLFSRMPEDLSAVIVAVDKKTNNTGFSKGEVDGVVTTTSDRLWLPSYVELSGGYKAGDVSDAEYQYVADITNTEGQEYKLFRDMNVDNMGSNSILEKRYNGSTCMWWERSPGPRNSDYFRGVDIDGFPGLSVYANYTIGVAPCFCI